MTGASSLHVRRALVFFKSGSFLELSPRGVSHSKLNGNQHTGRKKRRGRIATESMASDASEMLTTDKRGWQPLDRSGWEKNACARAISYIGPPWKRTVSLFLWLALFFCTGSPHDGKQSLFKQIEMKIENEEESNSISGPAISYSYCDVMDLKKYNKEQIGTVLSSMFSRFGHCLDRW